MDDIFALLLMASPILWLVVFVVTINTKYFIQLLTINVLAFATYSLFVVYFSRHFIGADEYSVGLLYLWLFFIVAHVMIAFIWTLGMQYRKRKTNHINNKNNNYHYNSR